MLDLLLWIVTWTPSLVISGGLGALGLLGPAFGAFKAWATLARVIGFVLICAHCFLWGFRTADDRAAQKALVDGLQTQVTSLADQLEAQKGIATIAAGERDRLREEKSRVAGLAEDYKARLAQLETKTPDRTKALTNACVLDDDDLRFRSSLRQRPSKRP